METSRTMARLDLQWKCQTFDVSGKLPSAIVHITNLRNPHNLERGDLNQTLNPHLRPLEIACKSWVPSLSLFHTAQLGLRPPCLSAPNPSHLLTGKMLSDRAVNSQLNSLVRLSLNFYHFLLLIIVPKNLGVRSECGYCDYSGAISPAHPR